MATDRFDDPRIKLCWDSPQKAGYFKHSTKLIFHLLHRKVETNNNTGLESKSTWDRRKIW